MYIIVLNYVKSRKFLTDRRSFMESVTIDNGNTHHSYRYYEDNRRTGEIRFCVSNPGPKYGTLLSSFRYILENKYRKPLWVGLRPTGLRWPLHTLSTVSEKGVGWRPGWAWGGNGCQRPREDSQKNKYKTIFLVSGNTTTLSTFTW